MEIVFHCIILKNFHRDVILLSIFFHWNCVYYVHYFFSWCLMWVKWRLTVLFSELSVLWHWRSYFARQIFATATNKSFSIFCHICGVLLAFSCYRVGQIGRGGCNFVSSWQLGINHCLHFCTYHYLRIKTGIDNIIFLSLLVGVSVGFCMFCNMPTWLCFKKYFLLNFGILRVWLW